MRDYTLHELNIAYKSLGTKPAKKITNPTTLAITIDDIKLRERFIYF